MRLQLRLSELQRFIITCLQVQPNPNHNPNPNPKRQNHKWLTQPTYYPSCFETTANLWHLWFLCAAYKCTYLLSFLLTYSTTIRMKASPCYFVHFWSIPLVSKMKPADNWTGGHVRRYRTTHLNRKFERVNMIISCLWQLITFLLTQQETRLIEENLARKSIFLLVGPDLQFTLHHETTQWRQISLNSNVPALINSMHSINVVGISI